MNDIDLLRRMRTDLPPPDGAALARGRSRLMAEALRTPMTRTAAAAPPRLRWRLVAAAAVLLAGAATMADLRAGPGGATLTGAVPMNDAAWVVQGNQDGTITVTLRHPLDLFDPDALARAITHAGAPAVVKIGDCTWKAVRAPSDALIVPGGVPPRIVINPALLPNGVQVIVDIVKSYGPGGAPDLSRPGTETPWYTVIARSGTGGTTKSGLIRIGLLAPHNAPACPN